MPEPQRLDVAVQGDVRPPFLAGHLDRLPERDEVQHRGIRHVGGTSGHT
ncbi:hypothetical protein [Actinoplanes sp. ATCC 53533]|nr:hypothetical protein [Actinoplanes sp. ATCC 53533]